jgi:hypothetical protein
MTTTTTATTTVRLADLQDHPAYVPLREQLAEIGRTHRLVYVRNPGNWGDALVHAGAEQLLKRVGAESLVLDEAQVAGVDGRTAALVVAGAGSWSSSDRSARDLVERLGPRFARTVVLPTTYALGPAALDPARVTYFRRDHLISPGFVVDAPFAPDLAFHVRLTAQLPHPRTEVRSYGRPARGPAPTWHRPGHLDPSVEGTSASPLAPFLAIVGRSTHVRTDRLHVAIAAALLGRDTELHGRRGDKADAVFRATLHEYPGASFVADDDADRG